MNALNAGDPGHEAALWVAMFGMGSVLVGVALVFALWWETR